MITYLTVGAAIGYGRYIYTTGIQKGRLGNMKTLIILWLLLLTVALIYITWQHGRKYKNMENYTNELGENLSLTARSLSDFENLIFRFSDEINIKHIEGYGRTNSWFAGRGGRYFISKKLEATFRLEGKLFLYHDTEVNKGVTTHSYIEYGVQSKFGLTHDIKNKTW